MSGKNIILGGKKINKSNSYKSKKVFNLYDIEVNKILISKKGPYGKKTSFKNVLVYNNDYDVIIILYKASSNGWICLAFS